MQVERIGSAVFASGSGLSSLSPLLTKDRDRLRFEEQRLLAAPLLEYDRVRLGRV